MTVEGVTEVRNWEKREDVVEVRREVMKSERQVGRWRADAAC